MVSLLERFVPCIINTVAQHQGMRGSDRLSILGWHRRVVGHYQDGGKKLVLRTWREIQYFHPIPGIHPQKNIGELDRPA